MREGGQELPGSTRPVLQPLCRFLCDHGRGSSPPSMLSSAARSSAGSTSVRGSSRWFSGWPPMSTTWSSAAARLAFPLPPAQVHHQSSSPLGATTVPNSQTRWLDSSRCAASTFDARCDTSTSGVTPKNTDRWAWPSSNDSGGARLARGCGQADQWARRSIAFADPGSVTADFLAKEPGAQMTLGAAQMVFRYQDSFCACNGLEGYERLILDAMLGDQALFTRADGVERLWEISAALLENPPPVEPYAPGSWGPEPALRRLAAPFRWRLPGAGSPS